MITKISYKCDSFRILPFEQFWSVLLKMLLDTMKKRNRFIGLIKLYSMQVSVSERKKKVG